MPRSASPIGSTSARPARTISVPENAVPALLEELDRGFIAEGFRLVTYPPTAGVARVYGRGSRISDTLLGGTGLDHWTTKIGPLSVYGRVVVWCGDSADGAQQVIVSQVAGDVISVDVVSAIDSAMGSVIARGVPVVDSGWRRAVDIPQGNPGNPKTARALGLN